LLFRPDDAVGAVRCLRRVAEDSELRARLIRAGHAYVRARTSEVESGRVADFLRSA
jgi:hypothetical protein